METTTATTSARIVSSGKVLPKHRPVDTPARLHSAACSKHDHWDTNCANCRRGITRTMAAIDRAQTREIHAAARVNRFGR